MIKIVPSARLAMVGSFTIYHQAYDPISNFRSCLAHEGFIKCKLISNHSDIHAFFTFYEGLTKVIRIFTRAVI